MHVRILGFDPGTANMGYATIEGEIRGPSISMPRLTDAWGVLTTDKEDGDVRERIDALGDEMRSVIAYVRPTHLAIEDFTEQGKYVGKTYKEMSWLIEHMRGVGKTLGYPTEIYENGYWKKQTLGIQRASKEQVQHFLLRKVEGANRLSKLPKSKNHIWDSVGIAYCLYTLMIQGVGTK